MFTNDSSVLIAAERAKKLAELCDLLINAEREFGITVWDLVEEDRKRKFGAPDTSAAPVTTASPVSSSDSHPCCHKDSKIPKVKKFPKQPEPEIEYDCNNSDDPQSAVEFCHDVYSSTGCFIENCPRAHPKGYPEGLGIVVCQTPRMGCGIVCDRWHSKFETCRSLGCIGKQTETVCKTTWGDDCHSSTCPASEHAVQFCLTCKKPGGCQMDCGRRHPRGYQPGAQLCYHLTRGRCEKKNKNCLLWHLSAHDEECFKEDLAHRNKMILESRVRARERREQLLRYERQLSENQ